MTTKFRNENGQFSKTNQNNGIEIEHEIAKIEIKRGGQCAPQKSNDVLVEVKVIPTGARVEFNKDCFGANLNSWRWRKNEVMKFTFEAETWREAFAEAHKYAMSELSKYDTLVIERTIALINAEL